MGLPCAIVAESRWAWNVNPWRDQVDAAAEVGQVAEAVVDGCWSHSNSGRHASGPSVAGICRSAGIVITEIVKAASKAGKLYEVLSPLVMVSLRYQEHCNPAREGCAVGGLGGSSPGGAKMHGKPGKQWHCTWAALFPCQAGTRHGSDSLSKPQSSDEASTQQLTGVLAARACDDCDASIGESSDSSCLAGVLCSIGQPYSHCRVERY